MTVCGPHSASTPTMSPSPTYEIPIKDRGSISALCLSRSSILAFGRVKSVFDRLVSAILRVNDSRKLKTQELEYPVIGHRRAEALRQRDIVLNWLLGLWTPQPNPVAICDEPTVVIPRFVRIDANRSALS